MTSKKLENCFNEFLPMNYRQWRLSRPGLTIAQQVPAELLYICCTENNTNAMKLAFERILGKPERALVITRVITRVIYPEALKKALKSSDKPALKALPLRDEEGNTLTVVDEEQSPSYLVKKTLNTLGDTEGQKMYDILEYKDRYTVAEVFCANVYACAIAGHNVNIMRLLFDYLDGAVADVVRVTTDDVLLLEDYAKEAPYEAKQDENGVWYVDIT